jgi:hypothetical protein
LSWRKSLARRGLLARGRVLNTWPLLLEGHLPLVICLRLKHLGSKKKTRKAQERSCKAPDAVHEATSQAAA